MTSSYAGDYPGNGRHRRGRRRRPNLMLLDPPSVTGLPPWQISGIALPRTRGRMLIAIVGAVALVLSGFTGIAVALRSAGGHAPFPHFTLTAPFPSVTVTATPHGTAPGQNSMAPASPMPTITRTASPSPTMTTMPVMATTPATAVTSPTAASPTATAPASTETVTVTYVAVSVWYEGLEGEVTVANSGYSPISGWQIAVALPYDHFTAVSDNSIGYVNDNVLVMHPASDADSVPARGTLTVYFTANGAETAPHLCAFNTINCT